jgi:hypothetical protein
VALKQQLERLARRTEREIAELWRRHQANLIDTETFIELAALVVARARARGVVLADLSVAAGAAAALSALPEPVGLTPPDNDIERLETSVRTILEEDVATVATPEELVESQGSRLARLARDAPAEAVTWAMSHAMKSRKSIGWVRSTDPNPCPMCTRLADGVVRSPDVLMKRHTGCMCVPEPVFGRVE